MGSIIVGRLLHCSTAIVAGATKDHIVNELTSCKPVSKYEKTKYDLEFQILKGLSKVIDVGILRPTAVVGPGGQNLAKLASELKKTNMIISYLRSSLYGRRPMHLVSIRNVIAAMMHLAVLPVAMKGNIYIVSDDHDPENNFQSIEKCLTLSMGQKIRKIPNVPLPKTFLVILLRLLGRSDFDMTRKYDSSKLASTGFVPVDSVLDAVHAFGMSINLVKE